MKIKIIKEEKRKLFKEQATGTFDAALEELRFVVNEVAAYAAAAETARSHGATSGAREAAIAEQEVYESVHRSLLPVLKMFEELQSGAPRLSEESGQISSTNISPPRIYEPADQNFENAKDDDLLKLVLMWDTGGAGQIQKEINLTRKEYGLLPRKGNI
mgnify:CR=1 FL=1